MVKGMFVLGWLDLAILKPLTRERRVREMIKYDYAQEKFSTAIEILAVSDLPLRERLERAFLHIRSLDSEKHLPEDLCEDFRKLTERRLAEIDDNKLIQTARQTLALAHSIEFRYYKSVCESVWRQPTD
jgi:hypothetical protein